MACAAAILLCILARAKKPQPEVEQWAPWWHSVDELARSYNASLTAAAGRRGSAGVRPHSRCHPSCTRRGNCNEWTGECECPLTAYGPGCTYASLPACAFQRGTADIRSWLGSKLFRGGSSSPEVGPVSCDCIEQAFNLRHYMWVSPVASKHWSSPVRITCAEWREPRRRVLTINDVISAGAGNVTWSEVQVRGRFLATVLQVARGMGTHFFTVERKGVGFHADMTSVPISRCPQKCRGVGVCVTSPSLKRAHCLCGGATGKCEQDGRRPTGKVTEPCPGSSKCSGQGTCDGNGFCHCKPGYWGLDCAETLGSDGRLALSLPAPRPNQVHAPESARPRVYVHSIPVLLRTGAGFYHDFYERLTDRVLASEYRTADPEHADYYWLPGPVRRGQFLDKLKYVKRRWPYWNQTVAAGEARHVVYTGWELDPGKIFAQDPFEPSKFYGPDMNVASPSRAWLALSHNGMADIAEFNAPGSARRSKIRHCSVCYQPGKDVVLPFKPGVIDVPDCGKLKARSIFAPGQLKRGAEQRPTKFFFAGSVPVPKSQPRKADPYELKQYNPPHVRADIHRLHSSTPGFKVVDSRGSGIKVDPVTWMLKSQFCWVPPGQRCARSAPRPRPAARRHDASRPLLPRVTFGRRPAGTVIHGGTSCRLHTVASLCLRSPTATSPMTSSSHGIRWRWW